MSISELKDGLNSRIAALHLRRKFFWLLAIVILGVAIYSAIILYYPFSEGDRIGLLRKFSHKGYVFKTWEGELQISAVMVPNDGTTSVAGGNIWAFSVNDPAVVAEIQKAEVAGKRVKLGYREQLEVIFWRGDTKYLVNSVTIIQE